MFLANSARATEETIRGTLETTAKAGATAQITDAMKEIYYVVKTPEAEKACAGMIGRKVALVGIVEQRTGDADYFFKLRTVEELKPKGEQPAKDGEPDAPAPKDDANAPKDFGTVKDAEPKKSDAPPPKAE
ncbi:MAG: hypothetical protein L6R28_18210 [Planctomycetes bacterium]|nr:hypothetical protein [Planctomycetota bacterium]